MIRGLAAADFGEVRRHAEALAANRYPQLIPSIDKMHALMANLRLDAGAYAKVIGPEGEPEAALIARTGENLWAARKNSSVLLWYTTRPGLGAVLLRDYRRWVMGQKTIVVAGFMDDYGMDERLKVMIERVGFKARGGMLALYPRAQR